MVDIQLRADSTTGADLVLTAAGLELDAGLQSSFLVAIFSDARAPEGAELEEGEDPRGWWGDLARAREIGSLLWISRREKITREALEAQRKAIEDALGKRRDHTCKPEYWRQDQGHRNQQQLGGGEA